MTSGVFVGGREVRVAVGIGVSVGSGVAVCVGVLVGNGVGVCGGANVEHETRMRLKKIANMWNVFIVFLQMRVE